MQALYITIFGINAVLLDVGIVNVFHFHAFASRVHHSRIRALRNSLGKKVAALPPESEGARTRISMVLAIECFLTFYEGDIQR